MHTDAWTILRSNDDIAPKKSPLVVFFYFSYFSVELHTQRHRHTRMYAVVDKTVPDITDLHEVQ